MQWLMSLGHRVSYSHTRSALVDMITAIQGSDGGVSAASDVHELIGFITFYTVLCLHGLVIWVVF